MADDVAITPGVGKTIAADDCSGRFVQFIKRGFGGNGRLEDLTEVAINCAGAGDNVIVAAVALQSVRLYGFFFSVNAAVNAKWRDGAAGTDFHPYQYFIGQGGYWELDREGVPWFTTSVGNALVLNLSGAVQVSGRAYYAQSA